jgi:hypothetical protein
MGNGAVRPDKPKSTAYLGGGKIRGLSVLSEIVFAELRLRG